MSMPPPPKPNRMMPRMPCEVIEPEEKAIDLVTRVTDEETWFLIKAHLRSDQLSDLRLIKFILSYLTCRSSPQAAEEAGYLRNRGSYYRSRPEVHAVIEAITAKALMKYGYDAGEIIERVKEIAAIDPICFENPDGSYKTHLSQIEPEARRAIKKFEVKNLFGRDANGMEIVIGQVVKVELWDKLKGLELLGREKNILKETKKIEHDVTNNMADVLLESRSRAEARMRNVVEITGRVESEISSEAGDREDDNG